MPPQVPPVHTSEPVHALLSLQRCRSACWGSSRCPFRCCRFPRRGTGRAPCRPPGSTPVQLPDWQVSVCVQALPSLQAEPFGLFGFEQTPVPGVAGADVVALIERRADHRVRAGAGARLAGVGLRAGVAVVAGRAVRLVRIRADPRAGVAGSHAWHWSSAVQTTGFAPVHVPDRQVSVCVQALPSLQARAVRLVRVRADARAGVAGPASWHWSSAVQTTGFEPDADAALAGVGLGAGVAVVAGGSVRRGGAVRGAARQARVPRGLADHGLLQARDAHVVDAVAAVGGPAA